MATQTYQLPELNPQVLYRFAGYDTYRVEPDIMRQFAQIYVGNYARFSAEDDSMTLMIVRYQPDRFEVHYFEQGKNTDIPQHFTVMADGSVPWSSINFVSTPSGFLRSCLGVLTQQEIEPIRLLKPPAPAKKSRAKGKLSLFNGQGRVFINSATAKLQVSKRLLQVLKQIEPGEEQALLNFGKVRRYLNGQYEIFWQNNGGLGFGNLITRLDTSGRLVSTRFGIPGNYQPYRMDVTMATMEANFKQYKATLQQ